MGVRENSRAGRSFGNDAGNGPTKIIDGKGAGNGPAKMGKVRERGGFIGCVEF